MIGGRRKQARVMLRPATGIFEVMLPEFHSSATYEVSLGDSPRAKDVCDWLGHVAEKRWASAEVLGQLVQAIDHVIGLRGLR